MGKTQKKTLEIPLRRSPKNQQILSASEEKWRVSQLQAHPQTKFLALRAQLYQALFLHALLPHLSQQVPQEEWQVGPTQEEMEDGKSSEWQKREILV